MDLKNLITFVVSVNNEEVFKNNFLASPLVQGDHGHQILAQRNFHSASEAYNEGIDQTESDLIIFTHQEVFFPEYSGEASQSERKDQKDHVRGEKMQATPGYGLAAPLRI